MKPILYLSTTCPHCYTVRKFIVDNKLEDKVEYRFVDRSDKAWNDMVEHGLMTVPALVVDDTPYKGDGVVIEVLRALK